jgi:membrane dipeptidase
MDRRRLLKAGLALSMLPAGRGEARSTVYVADMHFHLFFFGRNPAPSVALAREMTAAQVTLAAWSLVGDAPWLRLSLRGFVQKGTPGRGEAVSWLKAEIGRIKSYLTAQGLKLVRTPADVDLALAGEPHIVLSVEGASFADGDLAQIAAAYDAGVRHIQLVHYIRNTIGDFQTERPEHGGLTAFGRSVIAECNRLGILVDLAHTTPAAVQAALTVSTAPMVWSHGAVTRGRAPPWSAPAVQARLLPLETARAIAAKGGVVGLWALSRQVGGSVAAYADRLSELADWLGEDHAAFGTDRNGIAGSAIASFADQQRVVEHWVRRGVPEARITKLAIANYARVLKRALTPA